MAKKTREQIESALSVENRFMQRQAMLKELWRLNHGSEAEEREAIRPRATHERSMDGAVGIAWQGDGPELTSEMPLPAATSDTIKA